MATQTQSQSGYTLRRGRHAERGQTIVIALLVLLLLAFLGGLFASIVTRNLANAGRADRVQNADYYAESGVRFADEQLTFSTDGADWRPPLQGTLANPPTDLQELARYTAQNLTPASANDPDKPYLDLGFTRYNIGGGRFLLRVTYDPAGVSNVDNGTQGSAYSDPLGRYIKIESIGREGTVDPKDPTTFTAQANRLNATLIQYKAIGITDYARFVTNPDKRSDVMSLGVASQYHTNSGAGDNTPNGIITPGVWDFNGGLTPIQYPVVTTYGATDAFIPSGNALLPNPKAGTNTTGALPGGGSIRVNGSVRFYGVNDIYLDYGNASQGVLNDTVQIAGNLLLDNYTPGAPGNDLTAQDASVQVNPGVAGAAPSGPVAPSNDKFGYNSLGGAVRDGSNANDNSGAPRNVNRLEPPTLDSVNPATNLTRYRDITENAPVRTVNGTAIPGNPAGSPPPAMYGYGQAIYVDNATDVQQESSNLVGGYTLIDEWLHRTDAGSAPGSKFGWSANFYRPPGVDITLGRQVRAGKSFYGVQLTRSDVDGAGSLIGWKNPDNSAINGVGQDGSTTQSTMIVAYDDINASNVQDSTAAGYKANAPNPNNDVTIYAEGNVRLRGSVSADTTNELPANATSSGDTDDKLPRHVTIVTNGTAYIDGSLLRGNPESSIQVLAHDYVCVNTTQFLAGAIVDQNPVGTTQPGAFNGDPALRALDFSASDEELLQEFTFTGVPASQPYLYISGGPSAAGATAADFDIVDPRTGYSMTGTNVPPFAGINIATPYGPNTPPTPNVPFFAQFSSVGVPSVGTQTFVSQTGLIRTTFDLGGTIFANPAPAESHPYQLAIRRDPGSESSVFTDDFLLERAAVLPMEIRIEAGLFAQTRSFFVIPGDWFNSTSQDNVQAYANATGASRPGIDVLEKDENRFPFFGQPLDLKITIDGSVAEAEPADITAQTAWMLKWGWVPQYHGGLVATNTETSAFGGNPPAKQRGIGLNIIYNPLAGFPYYTDPNNTTNHHYLRLDAYGRPLPYAPKLPVCTGLLYAGQNTGESVLP